MHHLAIMKKSWGLLPKILSGEKTIESRWYKNKYSPWNKIEKGDILYFKNSGEPVTIKTEVTKILQFNNLDSEKIEQILTQYGKSDLGASHIMPEIRKYVSGKNYCILIFFNNVKKIKPFDVDKAGFGKMSAWISVNNINQLKKSK